MCVLITSGNIASQVFYFKCIILWLNFYFSKKPERAKKQHSPIIKHEIWSQASGLGLSPSSVTCKLPGLKQGHSPLYLVVCPIKRVSLVLIP